MSQIAQNNGFYDESHFNNWFKQYNGVSPKQYQVQLYLNMGRLPLKWLTFLSLPYRQIPQKPSSSLVL